MTTNVACVDWYIIKILMLVDTCESDIISIIIYYLNKL